MKYSHILTKSNQMTSINNIQRLAKSSIKKNSSKTRTKNKLNPGKPRLTLTPHTPSWHSPSYHVVTIQARRITGNRILAPNNDIIPSKDSDIPVALHGTCIIMKSGKDPFIPPRGSCLTPAHQPARPSARPPSPRPDLQRPEYFDQVPRIDI
jgi:hypothetical protein